MTHRILVVFIQSVTTNCMGFKISGFDEFAREVEE